MHNVLFAHLLWSVAAQLARLTWHMKPSSVKDCPLMIVLHCAATTVDSSLHMKVAVASQIEWCVLKLWE